MISSIIIEHVLGYSVAKRTSRFALITGKSGSSLGDSLGMSEGGGVFVQLVVLFLVLLLAFILLYVRYVKSHSCVNKKVVKRKRPSTSIRICCVAGSGMVLLQIACILNFLINMKQFSLSLNSTVIMEIFDLVDIWNLVNLC